MCKKMTQQDLLEFIDASTQLSDSVWKEIRALGQAVKKEGGRPPEKAVEKFVDGIVTAAEKHQDKMTSMLKGPQVLN